MEVELHSKAKHWGLMAYIDILANVLKGKSRIFKYIDLFCGDGKCKAIVGKDKPNPQQLCWDGPPIYTVKSWAKSHDSNLSCIFNDLDERKINNLKKTIETRGLNYLVEAFYSAEADLIVDRVISKHLKNPRIGSLIYLDPGNHRHLSWKTIEKFATFSIEDRYRGIEFNRKPELIINLMTYTMYRTYQQKPEAITNSLGTNRWKKKLKQMKTRKIPSYWAFYEIFIEQLLRYYPEEGIFPIHVHNLENRGMSYFLIYALTHPLAIKIFERDFFKRIRKYQAKDLEIEFLELKALSVGQLQLDSFFSR